MEKTLFFIAVLAMLCVSCSKDDENPSHDDGLQNGREYVDLGLPSGTKWATMNIGAKAPEEYGDYFAWGETTPKSEYGVSTYKYCNGSTTSLTKYCSNSFNGYNGFKDNKTVLDLEDDAAHVNWGGSWRMPTNEEWEELRSSSNCTWTFTTINGVHGYKVHSKITGYTDNWIFLPGAGNRRESLLTGVNGYGYYWSSSLNTDAPFNAWRINFYQSYVHRTSDSRFHGLSIRAVWK